MRLTLLLLCAAGLAACAPSAPPAPAFPPLPLATPADSLAARIYAHAGGPEVWERVPYVRFDFGAAADTATTRPPGRRHLWNRATGDYRLELPRGDTLYTALFNVNTRDGQVYRDGAALDSTENAAWLERAYRAYINDTYWLLVPTKLFDPGVTRGTAPDTLGYRVLTLAFEGVGLTPGDRYFLYANPETGALEAWGFVLEGNPGAPPSFIRREDAVALETPHGTARLATAHRSGNGRTLYTDRVALPGTVDGALFTDPAASLD